MEVLIVVLAFVLAFAVLGIVHALATGTVGAATVVAAVVTLTAVGLGVRVVSRPAWRPPKPEPETEAAPEAEASEESEPVREAEATRDEVPSPEIEPVREPEVVRESEAVRADGPAPEAGVAPVVQAPADDRRAPAVRTSPYAASRRPPADVGRAGVLVVVADSDRPTAVDQMANLRLLVAPEPAPPVRIVIEHSAAVVAGDHNLHAVLYVYEVRTPRVDLARCLGDADVRRRAAKLAAHPQDAALRRELVALLTGAHVLLHNPPVTLRIASLHSSGTPARALLGGLLLITDSRGVVVGDHGDVRSELVYLVEPGGDARALLAGHRELAEALVDAAFPPPGQAGGDALADAFRRVLAGLDVADDGIARGVTHPPPAAGTVLTITRTHGAIAPRARGVR